MGITFGALSKEITFDALRREVTFGALRRDVTYSIIVMYTALLSSVHAFRNSDE